jgi:uncharacterized C2H2 Zn-finger protein
MAPRARGDFGGPGRSTSGIGGRRATGDFCSRSEGLVRLTAVGTKPALWASSYGQSNVRTALFQAVKVLILQAGHHLLRCPECGSAFVAVRKQQYCTTRCAQKVRNDKKAAVRRG